MDLDRRKRGKISLDEVERVVIQRLALRPTFQIGPYANLSFPQFCSERREG
jgi:hypothetical protein